MSQFADTDPRVEVLDSDDEEAFTDANPGNDDLAASVQGLTIESRNLESISKEDSKESKKFDSDNNDFDDNDDNSGPTFSNFRWKKTASNEDASVSLCINIYTIYATLLYALGGNEDASVVFCINIILYIICNMG